MPNALVLAARQVNRPVAQRAWRRNASTWPGVGDGATFGGAQGGRIYESWNPWTFSPNFEVHWASRLMRARTRQLVRDNPYVAGVIGAICENVVGDKGRTFRAKIKLADGKTLATATNKELERAWGQWGYPENASADGRDSWVDIQNLHIGTMAADGEVLARKLRGFDNPFGYALQFIDADLLDETYNVPGTNKTNEIRMGVELDQYNRPVAYHIWNRYPTEKAGTPLVRERIPASEIHHDFIRYRANQVRGITWFAPVLTTLHTLGSYDEAERVAAWVAAAQMGFIVNKSPEAISAFDWKPEEMGKRTMDAEPGLLPELLPGQEFQEFTPNRPSTTHDQFSTTVLRGGARGLKVSHFTLTGDTRQANYSSMRVSLQPERDHWRVLQGFEAVHFDRLVYRDWLAMALLNGQIRVDNAARRQLLRRPLRGPRLEMGGAEGRR
jgi:lambda family phage portal protein